MKIKGPYNLSLLTEIKKLEECTKDELKAKYFPDSPNVLFMPSLFEEDLDVLLKEGLISIENGKIKYIEQYK